MAQSVMLMVSITGSFDSVFDIDVRKDARQRKHAGKVPAPLSVASEGPAAASDAVAGRAVKRRLGTLSSLVAGRSHASQDWPDRARLVSEFPLVLFQ